MSEHQKNRAGPSQSRFPEDNSVNIFSLKNLVNFFNPDPFAGMRNSEVAYFRQGAGDNDSLNDPIGYKKRLELGLSEYETPILSNASTEEVTVENLLNPKIKPPAYLLIKESDDQTNTNIEKFIN